MSHAWFLPLAGAGASALGAYLWLCWRLHTQCPSPGRQQAYLLGLFLPVLIGCLLSWHLLEDLYLGGEHGLPLVGWQVLQSPPAWWLIWTVGLTAAGGAEYILRHRRLGRRLESCACDDDQARRTQLWADALARQAGCRGLCVRRLFTCRPVAVLVGWYRPVLFLSSWYFDALTEGELRTVLAHELAHARRRDNLVAALGRGLLWGAYWLPTSRYCWERLLEEREAVADEWAAALTGAPLQLASALVKVAEAQSGAAPLPASTLEGCTGVERRVERLIAMHRRSAVECPRGRPGASVWLGAALATFLLTDTLPHLLDMLLAGGG
ncbi:M56 family metallopeptidase [Gloeobacter morelensis]|uniref:M56 family metallopeptidase n=1 Tax=Gloeobacter morelensis MG652769 TaxID=2781736 RepID=A0ABY3PPU9_9CYAN|nr:M56 family metallopeptidase [Gloeobacter morelensis]UFP95738.1 M56 family metallopeptidase [Gloeobacter morelensis MG652769]